MEQQTPPRSPRANTGSTTPKPPIGSATPPSAPTASQRPEPVLDAPEGFAYGPGERLIAQQDIIVTFTPRNAKRTSSILLWNQGASITRAEYEKRMELYAGYSNLEYKSVR